MEISGIQKHCENQIKLHFFHVQGAPKWHVAVCLHRLQCSLHPDQNNVLERLSLRNLQHHQEIRFTVLRRNDVAHFDMLLVFITCMPE